MFTVTKTKLFARVRTASALSLVPLFRLLSLRGDSAGGGSARAQRSAVSRLQ
jgi:hypothetical protein